MQQIQRKLAATQEIKRLVAETIAGICKFITDSCGEVREYMKLEHHARHEGLQVAGHALLR